MDKLVLESWNLDVACKSALSKIWQLIRACGIWLLAILLKEVVFNQGFNEKKHLLKSRVRLIYLIKWNTPPGGSGEASVGAVVSSDAPKKTMHKKVSIYEI